MRPSRPAGDWTDRVQSRRRGQRRSSSSVDKTGNDSKETKDERQDEKRLVGRGTCVVAGFKGPAYAVSTARRMFE